MLRHQLPVHSPLSIGGLLGAAAEVLTTRRDGHRMLRARLHTELRASGLVLTDSGTSALTLAIRGALRLAGASVALPAFNCYDMATAALGSGARVLLYDIDPITLAPDADSLGSVLDRGAGVVVCASLYGLPALTPECARLISDSGATLIVDAAQAWGATNAGRPVVSGGSLGVLSFGRGKGFTGGAGGALIACDALGLRVLDFAGYGSVRPPSGWDQWLRALAQWALARPAIYGVPASVPGLQLGATVFHSPSPPGELSEIAAAVLLRSWGSASREVATRRRNAARLLGSLEGHPALRAPEVGASANPSYLRLPVLVSDSARARVQLPETRALGIMPSYPRALADLDGFIDSVDNAGDGFAGARMLARSLCTLPTHGKLDERDMLGLETWIGRLAAGEGAASYRLPASSGAAVTP